MPSKVFYGSALNYNIQFSITNDHHYYSMPAISNAGLRYEVFYGSAFNSSIQFSITNDHHYYSMSAISNAGLRYTNKDRV